MSKERIMELKIILKDELEPTLWYGFPYYEGDPEDGFGFHISGYEKYPEGNHFTAWIPIEKLVSMEIKPVEEV
jgi:hypothetical protein